MDLFLTFSSSLKMESLLLQYKHFLLKFHLLIVLKSTQGC